VLAPELDAARPSAGGDAVQSFEFDAGTSLDKVLDRSGWRRPGRRLRGGICSTKRVAQWSVVCWSRRWRRRSARPERRHRTELLLLQGEIFLRRELSGEAVERFNDALGEIRRGAADDRTTCCGGRCTARRDHCSTWDACRRRSRRRSDWSSLLLTMSRRCVRSAMRCRESLTTHVPRSCWSRHASVRPTM
jgi:hypothetical protein